MTDVIGRMQRFTKLDRAEISAVGVDQMLRDLAAMLEPQTADHVEVHLEVDD